MKLKFSLTYGTMWGESLHVQIEYLGYDGSVRRHNLPMNTNDGRLWTLETVALGSRHHPMSAFRYCYQVENASGDIIRREWNMVPRIYPFDPTKDYTMPDSWRDIPFQYHMYTSAYAVTMYGSRGEEVRPLPTSLYRRTLLFRVSAPQLKPGQELAVCGSHPALGGWNTSRYMKMQYAGQAEWVLSVNVMGMFFPIEYKYVVVDAETSAFVAWEEGDNRTTGDKEISDGEVLALDGGFLRVSEDVWKIAGVVIPVFSLRSSFSYGVGDFGDLKRMVDWVVETGMKMIQILPINDTTKTRGWSDSYPYNAVSVYALHPHYVDLEAAGVLSDKSRMTAYHRQRQELNALPYSDYEAVDRVKTAYLHELYAECGWQMSGTEEYRTFVEKNAGWLMPYAAFCSMRDRCGTAHFEEWPEHSVYNQEAVRRYCDANQEDVQYVYFVQYLLHRQLIEAGDYARSKGVVIKGDIPIGVCRDSVDVWMQPQYFNLDSQTGAPPDAFTQNGQNWEFPTYNWPAMIADGCSWWRSRFAHMEHYFDAFRIDHVLGFFRIWEIPLDSVHGLLGHFSPALPLTSGEIEYFGLPFRKDLFTRPFINDSIIDRIFGVHAGYVRDAFLISGPYGLYSLKGDYDTQRKVERQFVGMHDEKSIWIRDGLYRLISNVLFVEDPRQPEMYHPRIGVYNEPVFDALSVEEKEAFMRLYNNYYYNRHNDYWREQAMTRLPVALGNTRMMVCAEDLGMLPDCVGSVLDALRIQTLEIQTMPKQSGLEFAHLAANPYRSVATFSTHDMPSLRMWWEESPERTQRYYVTMMQKEGRAPEHLPAHLAEEIVARHLYCPSMLCLLSFQDWMAMDGELRSDAVREERINVPADNSHRWKYRMHITIEELMKAERFNQKLRQMITRSRR